MRSMLFLLALAATTAGAPASWAAEDNCIFIRTVSGFRVIDNDTLIVYAGPREAYRVELAQSCFGLQFSETIAIDSRDSRMCWAANNHIITDRGQRCLVDTVLRMADEKMPAKSDAPPPAAAPAPPPPASVGSGS